MAPSGLNSKKFLDLLCGCNLPLKLTEATLTQKINYSNMDSYKSLVVYVLKVLIHIHAWVPAYSTPVWLSCVYLVSTLDVKHMRKCTRLSPEGEPWNMAFLSKGRAHACFLTLLGIHMSIYEPWMSAALIESDTWNEATCPFYPSTFHISLHPHLPVTTSLFAFIHLLPPLSPTLPDCPSSCSNCSHSWLQCASCDPQDGSR